MTTTPNKTRARGIAEDIAESERSTAAVNAAEDRIDRKNRKFIKRLAALDIDKIMKPYAFHADGDIPSGIKQFVTCIRKARELRGEGE